MLTCPDVYSPSRPQMARYVGLHNFAKFSAARAPRETKTKNVAFVACRIREGLSLLYFISYFKDESFLTLPHQCDSILMQKIDHSSRIIDGEILAS